MNRQLFGSGPVLRSYSISWNPSQCNVWKEEDSQPKPIKHPSQALPGCRQQNCWKELSWLLLSWSLNNPSHGARKCCHMLPILFWWVRIYLSRKWLGYTFFFWKNVTRISAVENLFHPNSLWIPLAIRCMKKVSQMMKYIYPQFKIIIQFRTAKMLTYWFSEISRSVAHFLQKWVESKENSKM